MWNRHSQKNSSATINGNGIKRTTREYGTFTSSLTKLKNWLLENKITHVVMESTGVYWKPVYHVLESSGITVWIVNARHVKNVSGQKTDKKDRAWLCKLLLSGLLKPSYIPPKEQRQLRNLTRYRKKMIQDVASNKNRVIRILEDCNVKLSSVLSDTSGVMATKLIDKLCEGKPITMQDIEAVYYKKIEATKEELWKACNGNVTPLMFICCKLSAKTANSLNSKFPNLIKKLKDYYYLTKTYWNSYGRFRD